MRLHRFYTSETLAHKKELTIQSAELVNQVRRVFRLKVGDEIILFDGSGSDNEYTIADWKGADGITLNLQTSKRSRYMPPKKIYLYAAIIKKDLFEMIVEKATELGVTDIIPVIADRTEKKSLNESRLNKIAVEASEQSGRGNIPTIHPMLTLTDAVKNVSAHKNISPIVFHTEGEMFKKDRVENEESLAVFIGPEGGWSPEEVDLFHKEDIQTLTLGTQVLRAETAVVTALSQVVFTV